MLEIPALYYLQVFQPIINELTCVVIGLNICRRSEFPLHWLLVDCHTKEHSYR